MSNKRSIAWHEEGLKNSVTYLERRRLELKQLQADIDRLVSSNDFSAMQIETAKTKGIDSFDADRFMKKKKEP